MDRSTYLIAGLIATAVVGSTSAAASDSSPVVVWFVEPQAEVSDLLANICADRNAAVIEQDDRHVLCQREVTGARGVLTQALLGNAYSTTPQLMIRFSLLKDGSTIRVQVTQWIELQMALGQTRRTPLNGRKERENLLAVLSSRGALQVRPVPEPTKNTSLDAPDQTPR